MSIDSPYCAPDGLVPGCTRLLHGERNALAKISARSEDPAATLEHAPQFVFGVTFDYDFN